MIKSITTTFVSLSLIALSSSMTFAGEDAPSTLATQRDRASYSVGLQMGSQVAQIKDEIDLEQFLLGATDSFNGDKPQLSVEEIQTALTTLQQTVEQKHQAKMVTNKLEGEQFLAGNKTKEGVITLESGLQYKVISEGTGAIPTATDSVTTHYKGTLIDGKVFDSSYDRGEPATFPVSRVIPGWTEALQKMKVGSKWQLYIPSELAYGEKGAGAKIGPNAVLIFDIELIKINEPS